MTSTSIRPLTNEQVAIDLLRSDLANPPRISTDDLRVEGSDRDTPKVVLDACVTTSLGRR